MGQVEPVNITGAALITQFSLAIILATCAILMYRKEGIVPFYRGEPRWSGLAWLILVFALVTIGAVIFSDEFSSTWTPLFRATDLPLIPWSIAVLLVFLIDIAGLTYLVWQTGGSRVSPFSPIFFILPVLAIFLREPGGHILTYLIVIIVAFVYTLNPSRVEDQQNIAVRSHGPYVFVAISCLLLATFVGFITRPR